MGWDWFMQAVVEIVFTESSQSNCSSNAFVLSNPRKIIVCLQWHFYPCTQGVFMNLGCWYAPVWFSEFGWLALAPFLINYAQSTPSWWKSFQNVWILNIIVLIVFYKCSPYNYIATNDPEGRLISDHSIGQ